MPRKNQKRKNANSQSGRRKAKPIKFNPNDIENEQREHCASSIEEDDDAVDDKQQQQHEQDQDHDKEMESIDGKVPIQEDDATDDDNGNNQIILISALDGNEINQTNQMDKTDDVHHDAAITIPVAYTDSPAHSTFNCNLKCKNCFFLFYLLN